MPEACFLCLDSTEYMRNGDYYPNRMFSMLEVANLLVSAKAQQNAENTFGFLTTGGHACTVYESLTLDGDRVLSALADVKIKGKECHFSAALRIAALALSHRTNPRSEKRVVIFIGSPIKETERELEVLAKKLKRDDVAVDVVSFGVPENVERLTAFVAKLNKQDNSFFIHVGEGVNMVDVLMDSRVFIGPDAAVGQGGGGGDFGFQVDPNADPDLQMALRLSMEEEWMRTQGTGGGASNAPPPPPSNPPLSSFDEDIQRAIQLSLLDEQREAEQRAADAAAAGTTTATTTTTEEPTTANQNANEEPEPTAPQNQDDENDEFMRELQSALEQSKKDNEEK